MQNRHSVGLILSMGLFVITAVPGCPVNHGPAMLQPLSRELPSEMIIPVNYQEISCPVQAIMDECEGEIISTDDSFLE